MKNSKILSHPFSAMTTFNLIHSHCDQKSEQTQQNPCKIWSAKNNWTRFTSKMLWLHNISPLHYISYILNSCYKGVATTTFLTKVRCILYNHMNNDCFDFPWYIKQKLHFTFWSNTDRMSLHFIDLSKIIYNSHSNQIGKELTFNRTKDLQNG